MSSFICQLVWGEYKWCNWGCPGLASCADIFKENRGEYVDNFIYKSNMTSSICQLVWSEYRWCNWGCPSLASCADTFRENRGEYVDNFSAF